MAVIILLGVVRILFYAINHVGLGHVVRLSVLARHVAARGAGDCYFFSESRHAASFFDCPGVQIDGEGVTTRRRWHLLDAGLRRAVDEVRPDVLVCDTYWSEAVRSIPIVQRRGGRAVLVLRMTDRRLMAHRLRTALPLFDTILLPHHPDELRWTYRDDPGLLRQLESPRVVTVGPVCRTSPTPGGHVGIIFTVGAGGEWPGASPQNTVDAFLRAYIGASRLLGDRGYRKPTLAAGAFLRVTREIEKHFHVTRTNALFEQFGSGTTVVTRGGYNTIWEAVAAQSRLVVCGTRNRLDDIKARSAFIRRAGLGRSVHPDARRLFDAIVRPWGRERTTLSQWSGILNAGLDLAVDELTGGTFLRARESSTDYAPSSLLMRASRRGRLVARFEHVDGRRPSASLVTAAGLALELGYETQLRLAGDRRARADSSLHALEKAGAVLLRPGHRASNHADCVSVLAWPGPRVRNELRISEELARKRTRGAETGLAIHADRVPLFLTEYLLRLFSLHNR